MSKKIGIVVPIHNGTFLTQPYIVYFSQFGDVHFINPLIDEVQNVDILVLPGGADVDPARYNDKPDFRTGKPNIFAEYFDTKVLPKYVEANIPIFGICRGFQTLAVLFGAPLTQHLDIPTSDPRDKCIETLEFTGCIQISKELQEFVSKFPANNKSNRYMVNSIHHQGIYDYNIKDTDIRPMAYSQEYGNIEAFYIENMPIACVQWHPKHLGLA